ncbi:aminotransferase class IV [Lichenihabitans psoromatis]|uniref:aminotransferase class IV n=1 Tax=Lichenihabitans psoromatis TaxID=2528642 RepID=UPI001036D6EC|nr:aminotransferase class IV [Lichenihabitans psoromatis]
MFWYRDACHADSEVPFNLADRGLLLGDGLFETMLVRDGIPHQAGRHLDRLMAGAATLAIAVERPVLQRAVTQLCAVDAGASRALRLTVTRGTGPRGLLPHPECVPTVFASTATWTRAMAFTPIRLVTSPIRRNASSPTSRLKTLGYLDNILALQDAKARGADDAMLLSITGAVACTSAANLFAVRHDRLLTPPASDGILPGTMRAMVLDLAATLGILAEERSVGPDDLLLADAVFATNSLRLLMPVTAIDGTPIPTATSPVYAALASALRHSLDQH